MRATNPALNRTTRKRTVTAKFCCRAIADMLTLHDGTVLKAEGRVWLGAKVFNRIVRLARKGAS
jgi:hypothetical protein